MPKGMNVGDYVSFVGGGLYGKSTMRGWLAVSLRAFTELPDGKQAMAPVVVTDDGTVYNITSTKKVKRLRKQEPVPRDIKESLQPFAEASATTTSAIAGYTHPLGAKIDDFIDRHGRRTRDDESIDDDDGPKAGMALRRLFPM
jgi:hypothetical protein